jgi:hypothetical protein
MKPPKGSDDEDGRSKQKLWKKSHPVINVDLSRNQPYTIDNA